MRKPRKASAKAHKASGAHKVPHQKAASKHKAAHHKASHAKHVTKASRRATGHA